MSRIIWFSNKTNSVGRSIETKTHKRMKDAIVEIGDSGYVERQEWSKCGKFVESQLIDKVINFKPSACEARAIEARITIPFPSLDLFPEAWR